MKISSLICRCVSRLAFWRRDARLADPAPPLPAKRPGNWRGVAAVAAGTKHVRARPPIPCQDAAVARGTDSKIHPYAFVADGAGSASLSHFGARETVSRLSHLSAALEDAHARMLDSSEPPSKEECGVHAQRFLIHASETIRRLTEDKSRPFKEFRCTLLAAVVGAERVFWIKVGDGQIVKETVGGVLQIVGPSGKGEHANMTHFVEEDAAMTRVAAGVFSATKVSGIALMTDGAAEKLVSNDGKKIAGRLSKFFLEIRQHQFGEKNLDNFLADELVWKPPGYTGDDKGIALLSRK